jgi:hypothetical protein
MRARAHTHSLHEIRCQFSALLSMARAAPRTS